MNTPCMVSHSFSRSRRRPKTGWTSLGWMLRSAAGRVSSVEIRPVTGWRLRPSGRRRCFRARLSCGSLPLLAAHDVPGRQCAGLAKAALLFGIVRGLEQMSACRPCPGAAVHPQLQARARASPWVAMGSPCILWVVLGVARTLPGIGSVRPPPGAAAVSSHGRSS